MEEWAEIITTDNTVSIIGTKMQSQMGTVVWCTGDLVSCFLRARRRTMQWEVENKWLSRKPHATLEPQGNLAHRLRQIRPLRFPGPEIFLSIQVLYPRLSSAKNFLIVSMVQKGIERVWNWTISLQQLSICV